jgi:holo-[acyl-carrier protein] synthase
MTIVGNGVDIIEVRRIKNAIDKYGQSFLKRIFTDKELKNAQEHNSLYQHLAGRFAAKEAVFKALGKATLNFKDLEVINDSEGKPLCSLLNYNQDKFKIHISISHIKNYAVANAIITQENSNP